MVRELTLISSLRNCVNEWRAGGQSVALVPTMGALHAGHLQLVKAAQTRADRVVVSIFVNPTQFGPNEDFHRYPRPLADDLTLLDGADADAAWLPAVEEMYPAGFGTSIHVAGVTETLDGISRPGHFDGVATVVAKLLLQVMPDIALFGEKDFQQLCVVKQLVRDLNIDTHIIGVPTVRETDGLALSSRNRYLSAPERAIAPLLYATLNTTKKAIRDGADVAETLTRARLALEAGGFTRVEYLELRAADTLTPLATYQSPARLLVAAHLGTTRLIDNISME